jgi:hypothetical protein
LRAAADIVGGLPHLAAHLATDETLLARYMVGYQRLPDRLLLKVIDIVLAEGEARARVVPQVGHQAGESADL